MIGARSHCGRAIMADGRHRSAKERLRGRYLRRPNVHLIQRRRRHRAVLIVT